MLYIFLNYDNNGQIKFIFSIIELFIADDGDTLSTFAFIHT
ncbi:MAG TPA: hypothetical protein PKM51_05555 [Chitinophagales bacterium]|nr:hypothetical protein [Chitinophagales bacterium]